MAIRPLNRIIRGNLIKNANLLNGPIPPPTFLASRSISYWLASRRNGTDQELVELRGSGVSNAQFGSASGSDANDPILLDWNSSSGDYVYLTGTASNYISLPDIAQTSPTGDIDIRVRASLSSWDSPSSTQCFVSKYGDASNISFMFAVTASGLLRLVLSSDGSAATTVDSSAGLSFADGLFAWVRSTFNSSTGDVNFYTSLDGESWSALGATQATAVSSIFDSNASVEIGSRSSGASDLLTGKISRCVIYEDLIESSVIISFNASSMGQSEGADDAGAGTWTINRAASGLKTVLVAAPVLLVSSSGPHYLQVSNNALLNFGAGQNFTVCALLRAHHHNDFDRIIDKTNGVDGYRLLFDNGGNDIYLNTFNSSTAKTSDRADPTTYNPSSLFLASGIRTSTGLRIAIDNVVAGEQAETSGNITSSQPLRVGTNQSGGNASDFEFFGAAIFRFALDSSMLLQVKNELIYLNSN